MKNNIKIPRQYIILLLIFLSVFFFRLFFVIKTSTYTGDFAYFHLRHVEYILNNPFPLLFDELSYGGKNIIYPPLFHYFLAAFSIFPGLFFAFKILPEILISLLVVLVYLISKEISKDENAALISALISGLVPLLIRETLNKASTYSLFLPLFFLMIYSFIKISDNKKYMAIFVGLSFLLPLIDPSSAILIFTLLLYAILLVSESIEIGNLRKEAIFFSTFIIVLINFAIYNSLFRKYGIDILESNIPKPIFELLYRDVSLLALIYFLGIMTLFLGIFGLYYGLFLERKRSIYLIASLMLTVLLLTTIKFIDFASGLIFIGVSFSILASISIKKFFSFLEMTKFNHLKKLAYSIIVILVVSSSIIPSISIAKDNINDSLAIEEIWALLYIKNSTPKESVILARFDEGHFISAIAERKNVIDSYFLLSDDVEKRFVDVESLYENPFTARALFLIRQYRIDYILLTEKTKQTYGIKELVYTKDKNCFELVYENDKAEVYKVLCKQ